MSRLTSMSLIFLFACETTEFTTTPLNTSGSLLIYSGDAVDDICSSGEPLVIPGSLCLIGTELTDLTALSCVTTVEGALFISGNPALVSLTGLENLTAADALIQVTNNPQLTDLDGLSGVTGSTGGLRVYGNEVLVDLTGLSGLTDVDGHLHVAANPALPRLDGLENLTWIADDLTLLDNAELSDITALHGISGIGGSLVVRDNPSLNQDDAQALFDSIGIDNIGGSVEIDSSDL